MRRNISARRSADPWLRTSSSSGINDAGIAMERNPSA
jgi:hypothetical protein